MKTGSKKANKIKAHLETLMYIILAIIFLLVLIWLVKMVMGG